MPKKKKPSGDCAPELAEAKTVLKRFGIGPKIIGNLKADALIEMSKALATAPEEETVERAIEILQGLRRHKDGSKVVKTQGIGPTGLAKRLFASSTAELKARALTILEELEKREVVIRTEGANKEPSFYPLDPKEARDENAAG